ncbi:MAG TPA: DUF2269 family protein [Thermoleophilaceae bacterium]|nr:DUF2269 family protein [Thermoleophilaceae bacterium]
MYDLLLTIHVLAAVVWVGGNISLHIFGRRVLKRGNGEEIYKFSNDINTIALRLYAPTSLILLVAGILLVNEVGYDFGDLWITLAFLGWIISFILGIGYYGPQDKKLQALVAAEGPTAPGVAANARQALFVNQIELLILVLVVMDMTVKPGL